MRNRIRIHFITLMGDPDSDLLFYADPDPTFQLDAGPDPTFHPDADSDPDPDLNFKKKAQTLEKVLK
jgi:hypothetical protein